MAHKGYTSGYFIDFFKSIPDHRWTEGELHKPGTVRFCALGHARRDHRRPLNEEFYAGCEERVRALHNLLEGQTANINDGKGKFKVLGKTPRGRILRALRNVRRKGSVL